MYSHKRYGTESPYISDVVPQDYSLATSNFINILSIYPELNLRPNQNQGWKFVDNVIPNIIYNTTEGFAYNQTSMIIWAKQNNASNTGITNPLFSMYSNDTVSNQKNPGFYLSPNRNLLWTIFV